jgi:hypothetical protein
LTLSRARISNRRVRVKLALTLAIKPHEQLFI